MESDRDSFRAQSGLDPIHYVTLPGRSARETPIHLITEQAYKDVRTCAGRAQSKRSSTRSR